PVDDRGRPDPRVPRGVLNHPVPFGTVRGAPDVVEGVILRDVVAAAEDPDLVIVDDCTMISPRRPGGTGRLQAPLLARAGGPDVVFEALVVAEVVIFRAPKDPHAPFEGHGTGGDPRAPPGFLGDQLPLRAVR